MKIEVGKDFLGILPYSKGNENELVYFKSLKISQRTWKSVDIIERIRSALIFIKVCIEIFETLYPVRQSSKEESSWYSLPKRLFVSEAYTLPWRYPKHRRSSYRPRKITDAVVLVYRRFYESTTLLLLKIGFIVQRRHRGVIWLVQSADYLCHPIPYTGVWNKVRIQNLGCLSDINLKLTTSSIQLTFTHRVDAYMPLSVLRALSHIIMVIPREVTSCPLYRWRNTGQEFSHLSRLTAKIEPIFLSQAACNSQNCNLL